MTNETLNDKKNISHKIVVDLLRITMLVYDYGDKFSLDNSNQTIEEFMNNPINKTNIINNTNLGDIQKNVLLEISKNCSSGKVCKFISDKETDIQVGITLNDYDKRICVVFRGSESLYDWYYDLNVKKIKLKDNIMVHSGFYRQLFDSNVYKDIVNEVKKQLEINPDYAIYITGHSLGSALSTLFGYLLSNEISNNIIVVSFASPRIGNDDWKKSFESKKNLTHYRVTNNRDIVTAFPLYDYKHVGHNIRLFSDSVETFLNYNDESWYDYTLLRCWSIGDHNTELYYKHLVTNIW
jgi:hypothetical protein